MRVADINTFVFTKQNFDYKLQLQLCLAEVDWRYDRELFKLGSQNILIYPPIMGVLYKILETKQEIVMYNRFKDIVKWYYQKYDIKTRSDILFARIYQTQTGFLRELFVIQYLVTHSDLPVYKILCLDYQKNIDLVFNNINVAIKHEGQTSFLYDIKKKNTKILTNRVELISKNIGEGLHLVDEIQIQKLL